MLLKLSAHKLKPDMYEFDALGTRWWCEVINGAVDDALRLSIDDAVQQFVADYSRFDENSLLSQLCRDGYLNHPPAEMVAMLEFAREVFDTTDGVFNISVGGVLERAGYGHGVGGETNNALWSETVISDNIIRVPKGARLDFGGFGKGWLIDKLADLFRQHGVEQFIINGGGDLFVQSNTPVELSLEHPLDATKQIGTTQVQRGGLAVSSTIKRQWQKNGATHHHIIDPSLGASSQSGVASVYAKAPTVLIADTLATVLIVNPSLKQKLERYFSAQVIIVYFDQLP